MPCSMAKGFAQMRSLPSLRARSFCWFEDWHRHLNRSVEIASAKTTLRQARLYAALIVCGARRAHANRNQRP